MIILYIEDDTDDVDIFCEAVREVDESITCIVASNGLEGFELMEHLLPDFVFLDIDMPLLDGKTTLRRIRGCNQFECVPVCVLSTSMTPMDAETYTSLGADYCLAKPDRFDQLCSALKSLCIPTTQKLERC